MNIQPVEIELFQNHARSDGETEMTTLKVGFGNFANAHVSKNKG